MAVLDYIFPKRCLSCGSVGAYFCARCRPGVRHILPTEAICPVCGRPAIDGKTHPRCRSRYSLDGLTSFFRYDGIVKKAVTSLKYRGVFDLATAFIALISSGYSGLPGISGRDDVVLVPIPLHTHRQRTRGFNQAEILGSTLAQRLHIKMHTGILRRIADTPPQVSMKERSARFINLRRAFTCESDDLERYNSIILLDDVYTTGATMRSAGHTLKRAGARFVWAVTMAR